MRVDGSPGETSIERMSRHLVAQSGKLFRATLILLSVRALAPAEERGPKLAAAMELIHLATLLHDDVIDRAEVRRGCPSLPSVFDNSPTVLMGDHLFARAFELIAECGHLGIISSSCRATSAMCRGEIEQLQWINHADVTEEVYFRLIEMKTAALMGSCTESAALLCGQAKNRGEWYRFGLTLGLLFQMTDDLLDFTGDELVFGKQTGSDAAAGKYTLPLILLRDRMGSPEALQKFLKSASSPLEMRERLGSLGVFQEVRQRLADLAESCRTLLTGLSAGCQDREAVSCLEDLVDFVLSRDH
jgi:octaprenyl-diphosphate synthase